MTTSDPAAVVLPRHCTTTSPRPTLSGLLAHATLYYYIFLPNTTPPYTGLLHAQTGGSAEGPPRAAPRTQPAPLNSTRHHPSAVSIRPVIFHQASVISMHPLYSTMHPLCPSIRCIPKYIRCIPTDIWCIPIAIRFIPTAIRCVNSYRLCATALTRIPRLGRSEGFGS